MKGTIPSAGHTCTQRGWGLLIPVVNTYTTFGTKAMSKQELSPFNSFRRMRRVGLTLQIPEPATSTGDELIQRPCDASRMWIGLARPEIVNTQADQYRPVFRNPVHLDVQPPTRRRGSEPCLRNQLDAKPTVRPNSGHLRAEGSNRSGELQWLWRRRRATQRHCWCRRHSFRPIDDCPCHRGQVAGSYALGYLSARLSLPGWRQH